MGQFQLREVDHQLGLAELAAQLGLLASVLILADAKRQALKALRRTIAEAHEILQTSPGLPQGRTARANELLGDAVVLADLPPHRRTKES